MATSKKQKQASNEAKNLCRMVTPIFRVSYPHVFKAQAPKATDKPKFSITMLFPKDTDLVGSTLATETSPAKSISLKRIMKNAKIAEFGPDENDWPEELESPVVDGDDPKYTKNEGYKGHWVIKATTSEEQRPGVVDRDGTPITNAADFYPGCYARAYVYARVWEYMGKQGVQFILDHVQKMKDGKSFGGKKPVDQVFGPVGAGADDNEEMDFM